MASMKKDGNVWRVQVNCKGVRDSGTFATKAQAKAWADKRETEVREQASSGINKTMTCEDLFTRYEVKVSKTKAGARWEALRLRAFSRSSLGRLKVFEVQTIHIAEWRDARLQEVAPSTVNREMNLLSHCFAIARDEWKWIKESPTRKVRRPKDPPPRNRRITQEESDKICCALGFDGFLVQTKSQAVAGAFLFAIETAMRVGEICSLLRGNQSKVKNASYLKTKNLVHLGKTKNGDERDVPLSPRAVELLAMLPLTGPAYFSFTSEQLDALFRKARDRAGIEDLHFHDTRHEAISRLARRVEVVQLARMVGHRNLSELLTYYNPSDGDLEALAQQL